MKFMNKNKKGFTLVELMIVVVIMAILVAVAVPIFNAVTTNAKKKTCNANARTLSGQINTIVMNEVGGGTDDKQVVSAQELTDGLSINELLGKAKGTDTRTFKDYIQGGKMPVCPFDETNKYYTGADGKVYCGTALDTPSEHDLTYVEPTTAP